MITRKLVPADTTQQLAWPELEQRKKLYHLREAIAKSEALFKEGHLNIFEDDYDSDDDVDEDQIYSYYFDDHQEETDYETDGNIEW